MDYLVNLLILAFCIVELQEELKYAENGNDLQFHTLALIPLDNLDDKKLKNKL